MTVHTEQEVGDAIEAVIEADDATDLPNAQVVEDLDNLADKYLAEGDFEAAEEVEEVADLAADLTFS